MVVNSGGGVGLGYHNGGTEVVRFIDDSAFPDHTLCLTCACIDLGGLCNLDWGSHRVEYSYNLHGDGPKELWICTNASALLERLQKYGTLPLTTHEISSSIAQGLEDLMRTTVESWIVTWSASDGAHGVEPVPPFYL